MFIYLFILSYLLEPINLIYTPFNIFIEYWEYLYPIFFVFIIIYFSLIWLLSCVMGKSKWYKNFFIYTISYYIALFLCVKPTSFLVENHIREIAQTRYQTEPEWIRLDMGHIFIDKEWGGRQFNTHSLINVDGQDLCWSFKEDDFVDFGFYCK